jgi:hypothetical protein
MKKFAIVALLSLGLWLSSCASNTVVPAVTTGAGGNWEAQLLGGVGEASLLDFTTDFSVGAGDTTLDIHFPPSFFNQNSQSCFQTIAAYNGSVVLTTSASNQVTGSMTYTITSDSGNALTLTAGPGSDPPTIGVTGISTGTSDNGVLSNGAVFGVWTLTEGDGGTGCAGSGTFTMCQEGVPKNGACGPN